jgi:hypothetical protein
METLADFDFSLHHIPGHANTITDFLSQHPDLKEGVKHVNENITVLPPELFTCKILLPSENEKQREAIREFHDTLATGHPGIANTWVLVNRKYEEGL